MIIRNDEIDISDTSNSWSASSALSDWLVFVGIAWFGGGYLTGQLTSRLAGGITSFVFNKNWSFRSQSGRGLLVQTRHFLFLYAVSYVISLSSIYAMVEIVGVNRYWGKLIADSLCFIFNFCLMKLYVFHEREGLMRGLVALVRRSNPFPFALRRTPAITREPIDE
jgi:putative flippase GtrA